MKRLLYLVLISAAATCFHASAQTTSARAHIPFPFQVGDSVMPAGDYTIGSRDHIVTVSDRVHSRTTIRLSMPLSRAVAKGNPTLDFKRFGSTYYLVNLWEAHSNNGQNVLTESRQKQLEKQYHGVELAEISMDARGR